MKLTVKKLVAIGGKPTKPRAKKGEKILKSVHELNKGLKDVMESTAEGKKVKDVSREVLPAKRKPAEVNEVCDVGSDMVITIPSLFETEKCYKIHPRDLQQVYGGNAHWDVDRERSDRDPSSCESEEN